METSKQQGQLFANPFLEALTKAPAWIACTYYPAVVLGLLSVNMWILPLSKPSILASFGFGLIFWTFFEYVMHRYVFHFVSQRTLAKRVVYTVHGIHHDYPKDEERLIMPPVPWTLIVSVLVAFSVFIAGSYGFSFIGGLITGYLAYIYVHFQVHIPNGPKFLKTLRIHHAYHHHKNKELAFGVSNRFWDRIFGTMPIKKKS